MRDIGHTFVNTPEFADVRRWFRANLEWLGAAGLAFSLVALREEIAEGFTTGGLSLPSYYNAMFSWASLQVGFLFGVYAFFLSRSEPFLQAISSSVAFRSLRRYIVRTLYLALSLSVLSLPLVVYPLPLIGENADFGYVAFVVLTVLTVYTFLSFLKVVRVFGKIERRS